MDGRFPIETPKRRETFSETSACPFAYLWQGNIRPANRVPPNKTVSLPPGPKGLPVLGNYLAFCRDPLSFFSHLAADYGDVSHFRIGRESHYFLNHPDLIRDVLVRESKQFEKAGILVAAQKITGTGILTSEGNEHRRQRRMLQPAFTSSAVQAYARVMPETVDRWSARWSEGESVSMTTETSRVALAIVVRTLFDDRDHDDLTSIERAAHDILGYFDPVWVPFALLWGDRLPRARRFTAAKSAMTAHAERLIKRFSADDAATESLVGRMIQSMRTEGFEREELIARVRDQIITLVLAGHETVATALNWTFMLLADHPAASGRLEAEIDAVCGSRLPAAGDVPALLYTERVFKEAMRLYPPAWIMKRRVLSDHRAGNYIIPAGSFVGMSPYVMHRDPRYFPDPERFDPDRWSAEAEASRPAYSYFPFSGGPRGCIGSGFAMMEAILTIATVSRRWRFERVDGARVGLKPLITLRPDRNIRLRVRDRLSINPGATRRVPTVEESR